MVELVLFVGALWLGFIALGIALRMLWVALFWLAWATVCVVQWKRRPAPWYVPPF